MNTGCDRVRRHKSSPLQPPSLLSLHALLRNQTFCKWSKRQQADVTHTCVSPCHKYLNQFTSPTRPDQQWDLPWHAFSFYSSLKFSLRKKSKLAGLLKAVNWSSTIRPSRVGKLFWESTASTTSTLSTTTQCFVVSQAGALIACTQGRKKRALSLDEAEDCDCEISASKSSNAYEDVLEGEEEDVQPGIEGTPNRQARLVKRLIYARCYHLNLSGLSYIGRPQHLPRQRPHTRRPQLWRAWVAPPMGSPSQCVARPVWTIETIWDVGLWILIRHN